MEKVTPALLWQSLRTRAPLLSNPVTVQGIFSGFNSEREYAGKRYATLIDPNDGRSSITLRIPSPLALKLVGQEGALLTLKGVPYWDIKPEFGKAKVVLEVGKIGEIETDHIRFEETALIIEEKLSKGWRDVGEMLRKTLERGEKPRIALVVGETAISGGYVCSTRSDSGSVFESPDLIHDLYHIYLTYTTYLTSYGSSAQEERF